ncbi:MAG: DUF2277 domain-containing protein [Acidimicrobiales bacterium]
MCRSIVVLRGSEPTSDEDVHAAALQFVRKVSGYRQPSKSNVEVFDRAVEEVTASVRRLLDGLVTPPGARPPALQGSRARAAGQRATQG